MLNTIWDFFSAHPAWGWGLVALSAFTFIASLVLLPMLLIRLPEDYYISTTNQRPRTVLGLGRKILVNILGIALLIAGIFMLVLPGQGLLTIAAALACLDFPGKRQLERRILSNRHVFKAANWIRQRAGRAPLRLH